MLELKLQVFWLLWAMLAMGAAYLVILAGLCCYYCYHMLMEDFKNAFYND